MIYYMKILINFLKAIQIFLGLISILILLLIFSKYGDTTGCQNFDYAYKILISLFLFSGLIFLFARKMNEKLTFFAVTPIAFLVVFTILLISNQLNLIRIYEQWVGGARTMNSFTNKGKECDLIMIKLFSRK